MSTGHIRQIRGQLQVTGQAIIVLLDQALCSVVGFSVGVLLARTNQADYALYVLGYALLGSLMNIQAGLTGTPYMILVAGRTGLSRRRLAGSTLVEQLGFSIVCAAGVCAAGLFARAVGTVGLSRVLLALSIATPLILLRDYVRYFLLASFRTMTLLAVDAVMALAVLSLLVMAVVQGRLSATRAYFILAVASGGPAIWMLCRARSDLSFCLGQLCKHVHENWRLGRWIAAEAVVCAAGVHVYPWLLAGLADVQATAIYGACLGLTSLANPFLVGVNRLVIPRVAHASRRGTASVEREVRYWLVVSTVIMTPFLLLLMMTGEELVVIVYGNGFAGLGPMLVVLGLSVVLAAYARVIRAGLLALQRSRTTLQAQVLTVGVSLTVGVWLVRSFGALGATWAVLLARGAALAYSYSQWRGIFATDAGVVLNEAHAE